MFERTSFAGQVDARLLASLIFAIVITTVGCTATVDQSQAALAPKLVSVEPMVGSLHVSWQNQSACDVIELERTNPGTPMMASFTLLYKLPGAADNKHDATATQPLTYTYRARCARGGQYSAYSNELSGDPTVGVDPTH